MSPGNAHDGRVVMSSTSPEWWNVTKYIYSSTVLKCNFEVLLLVFPFYATSYFYSLLHYIYLTDLVTSYFADSDY